MSEEQSSSSGTTAGVTLSTTNSQQFAITNNNSNEKTIFCKDCTTCKILRPGVGSFLVEDITLPGNKQCSNWWIVKDMFDFENIGFLKQVSEGIKYLTCADCEHDVLGLMRAQEPNKIYLSAERVIYK